MARSNSYHSTEHTRTGAITKFGSRTDVGCVREQNEDSLVVKPPLFVVADGMGGHAAGEIASEICVKTLEECAPEHADAEALGKAVEQANRDIISAAIVGEGRDGMGTTCTAAMLEHDKLVIAQVGDSRAYLLHDGKLSQLTRDHSLMANMIEAGQITPEEARIHPNRSVITRALGNDIDTVPDLYEINVEADDRLLLCSDGLSGMLTDKQIESTMNRIADPQRCASVLVNEAIAAGGGDNVTVIVADATGPTELNRKKASRKSRITAAIVLLLLAGIIAAAIWGTSTYLHHTAFLAEDNGNVAVYRGVPGEVLGFTYSELVEETDISLSDLPPSAAERIRDGMRVDSVEEAQKLIESYRADIEKKKQDEAKQAEGERSSSSQSQSASASNAASASSEEAASSAEDSAKGESSETENSPNEGTQAGEEGAA